MADPPRLPPPPFWRTQYFALTVMAKADRRWIDPLDVEFALSRPVRRERQADGRVRYWAYIPRLGTYIRVVRSPTAILSTTYSRTATSPNECRSRLRSRDRQPLYQAAARRVGR